MRARGALAIFAALGVITATAGSPAAGSRGAALDIGRIEIEQALTPGGAYQLPALGVRNPGTETTQYAMLVLGLAGTDSPPETWFEFSPRELTLAPGKSRQVRARINLPPDAEPGDYTALVGAQLVAEGKGAQVGATAAARTTFTVEPASTLQAWWLELKTFLGDYSPWSWLVPALALLAAALAAVRRRFSLSLTVARRA